MHCVQVIVDGLRVKWEQLVNINIDILNITQDTIFVAHNVNFDYNVIRNEFKAIHIDFNRKK